MVEQIPPPAPESATLPVSSPTSTQPGLLGVSLTTRQWLRAREVIGAIRAKIDVPVIAGGLHPTFAPEAVLSASGFDYVCLGEGEEPMLDVVQALSSGIPVHGICPA